MRNFFAFASLCLVCVLGPTLPSHAQSTAVPMSNQPIAPTSWGFDCLAWTECGTNGSWLPTTSQPGTARLWNAGVTWNMLETANGTYDWTNLDTWLDLLAEHQPRAAIFTFGHTPCWIATTACTGDPANKGAYESASPPSDLTAGGSATFSAFVTQLVQHCSAAGHCVKDYIKHWEMWNEANNPTYWTGTVSQLYDILAPIVPIIRNYVPGAMISTPPPSGCDEPWMASWMALENSKGRLSDYYGFHFYLMNFAPEARMPEIEKMLATKNSNGWTTTPWMNTETNFLDKTYACSTEYTAEECRGDLVRWHVLLYAYQGAGAGAYFVGWYNWDSITNGGYDTYYYTMMQWLTGATFTASCTSNGNVWTCPLTEASGASALIVWNVAGHSTYRPASQYIDYRKFDGTYGGATESISAGEATTIRVVPIMFETVQ